MSWPIKFTFHGEPVTALRVKNNGKHHYNPTKYTEYKKALTAALNAEFGYYGWDIPLVKERTARSKWIKANRYRLLVSVYRLRDSGDCDNFGKVSMDAIQQAGIIADDKQIDKLTVYKEIVKDSPRIEIKLWRI